MQRIILQEPGKLIRQSTKTDMVLSPNEALVKVHRIGVCGTDYHAYRGKQPFFTYPRVLGHELGVEVVQVREGEHASNIKVGDTCAVEPYLNCGNCQACRSGKSNCCQSLQVLGVHTDGGMQEYIKVPVTKLHHSGSLSFEQLALVETLGIGGHAVARAQVQATDTVLVIGAGPIGLSVIQFLEIAGAKIVVMDMAENRLTFCQEHFKIHHTLIPGANTIDQIKQILDGNLPTIVFDATGNPASMMQAFSYVAHGGKLVFVGLFPGDITFNDPEFHRRELTLFASRNALSQDFKNIIHLMEAGKVNITPWISHWCAFAELPDTFADWLQPESQVIKAMVAVT